MYAKFRPLADLKQETHLIRLYSVVIDCHFTRQSFPRTTRTPVFQDLDKVVRHLRVTRVAAVLQLIKLINAILHIYILLHSLI